MESRAQHVTCYTHDGCCNDQTVVKPITKKNTAASTCDVRLQLKFCVWLQDMTNQAQTFVFYKKEKGRRGRRPFQESCVLTRPSGFHILFFVLTLSIIGCLFFIVLGIINRKRNS